MKIHTLSCSAFRRQKNCCENIPLGNLPQSALSYRWGKISNTAKNTV
jgi:hypothetical protein